MIDRMPDQTGIFSNANGQNLKEKIETLLNPEQ